jgi:hypothetical protein
MLDFLVEKVELGHVFPEYVEPPIILFLPPAAALKMD